MRIFIQISLAFALLSAIDSQDEGQKNLTCRVEKVEDENGDEHSVCYIDDQAIDSEGFTIAVVLDREVKELRILKKNDVEFFARKNSGNIPELGSIHWVQVSDKVCAW